MKIIINGNKQEMSYEDVCKRLGFIPEIHFVKVTTRGTVDFTIGKPNEIRALKRAITREGMVMSKKLKEVRI